MSEKGNARADGSVEFDPCHSALERDRTKLLAYVRMLEEAFGREVSVVGVLEIGSYAKCEAVPSSDTDTRVYVASPDAYLFNTFGGLGQAQYDEFVEERGELPRRDLAWAEFNDSLCEWVMAQIGCNVEFGFIDVRYAGFELARLDRCFSSEHALLFQSNVLHDPSGFLARWRRDLWGMVFAPLVRGYRERYLDQLYRKVYDGLEPNRWDEEKLRRSGQIIWVQRAVRCLRNAVAAKVYGATGTFIYRKPDVLAFYRRHLADDLSLVLEAYGWKTDPQVRAEMVAGFKREPDRYYPLFRSRMPQLEEIVAKVRDLDDDSVAEGL